VKNSVAFFYFAEYFHYFRAIDIFDQNLFGTLQQSVDMLVKSEKITIINPDDFIDPVAKIKSAVSAFYAHFFMVHVPCLIITVFHWLHLLHIFCKSPLSILQWLSAVHRFASFPFSDASYLPFH